MPKSESEPITPQSIELTAGEFEILKFGKLGNFAFDNLVAAKGIRLNGGDIPVRIDGVEQTMVTDANDFGTLIQKNLER